MATFSRCTRTRSDVTGIQHLGLMMSHCFCQVIHNCWLNKWASMHFELQVMLAQFNFSACSSAQLYIKLKLNYNKSLSNGLSQRKVHNKTYTTLRFTTRNVSGYGKYLRSYGGNDFWRCAAPCRHRSWFCMHSKQTSRPVMATDRLSLVHCFTSVSLVARKLRETAVFLASFTSFTLTSSCPLF
jgi:hypothetical protein